MVTAMCSPAPAITEFACTAPGTARTALFRLTRSPDGTIIRTIPMSARSPNRSRGTTRTGANPVCFAVNKVISQTTQLKCNRRNFSAVVFFSKIAVAPTEQNPLLGRHCICKSKTASTIANSATFKSELCDLKIPSHIPNPVICIVFCLTSRAIRDI